MRHVVSLHLIHKIMQILPTWSSLRKLGNSRLLRTSYFWMVFVPIAVKFLENANLPLKVNIWGTNIELALQLPFSWELFFYSSVITSFANICYILFCPSIIKNYDTFIDFREEGKGEHQLKKEFQKIISKYSKEFDPSTTAKNLEQIFSSFSPETFPHQKEEVPTPEAISIIDNMGIYNDSRGEFFWFVRDIADKLSNGVRWIVFLLYSLGILLILIVLLQNIFYVIEYSLNIH